MAPPTGKQTVRLCEGLGTNSENALPVDKVRQQPTGSGALDARRCAMVRRGLDTALSGGNQQVAKDVTYLFAGIVLILVTLSMYLKSYEHLF